MHPGIGQLQRAAGQALLCAEEDAALVVVEPQSPKARVPALAQRAVAVEPHGPVAESGGPDSAVGRRRDVHCPARGQAGRAIERVEPAAAQADDAGVLGGEPDVRAADRDRLERRRPRGVRPAAHAAAADRIQRHRSGREQARAGAGEAIDAALQHARFPAEAAPVAGEEEPFARRHPQPVGGGPEIVDHPERSGHGAEASAFEDADAGIEGAGPERAAEDGERLDVVPADLAARRDRSAVEPEAGAVRRDELLAVREQPARLARAVRPPGKGRRLRRDQRRRQAHEPAAGGEGAFGAFGPDPEDAVVPDAEHLVLVEPVFASEDTEPGAVEIVFLDAGGGRRPELPIAHRDAGDARRAGVERGEQERDHRGSTSREVSFRAASATTTRSRPVAGRSPSNTQPSPRKSERRRGSATEATVTLRASSSVRTRTRPATISTSKPGGLLSMVKAALASSTVPSRFTITTFAW